MRCGWVQLGAALAHEPIVLKAASDSVEPRGVLDAELLPRLGSSDPGLIHYQSKELVTATPLRAAGARAHTSGRGGPGPGRSPSRAAVDASPSPRLQPAEGEVKARSEHDQRPKRGRDDCRDDLGDGGEVGVVVVPGGDQYAEHDVCDRDQAAHWLIFAYGGAPLPRRL